MAYTEPIDSRPEDSGTIADMYILVNESISYYRRISQSEWVAKGLGVVVVEGAAEEYE